MGTRAILIVAIVALIFGAGSSGLGALRRAPAFVRLVVDALVVAAAVRIGLSVAIIAFDSTAANVAIPIAAGVLAAVLTFWLRRSPSASSRSDSRNGP